jgi:hypothetical protein
MIRFRFSADGVYWFSPDRKWLRVTEETTKDFLLMLNNVTKGYPNE